ASGIFAPNSLSVGDLFAGAIVPALTLVALYIVYLIIVALVRPQAAPAIPPEPDALHGFALVRRAAESMVAPVLLIVPVLGSILAGLATPTESAAVGAFGALALTARKVDPARAWPVTLGLVAIVAALVLHGFTDVRLNRAAAGIGDRIALAVSLAL